MIKSKHGYARIVILGAIVAIGLTTFFKGVAKTAVKKAPTAVVKQVKQYGIITKHMSQRISERAMLNGVKSTWIKETFNNFSKNISKQGIKNGNYNLYAKAPNGRWIKIPIVVNNGEVIGKTFMVTSKKQGDRLNEKGLKTFLEKSKKK